MLTIGFFVDAHIGAASRITVFITQNSLQLSSHIPLNA